MMKVSWSAPSNIALVKYWGKKTGLQLPANPSVSFTLSHCHTQMDVSLEAPSDESLVVLLDGQEKPSFKPKIEKFLTNIAQEMPFLKDYSLTIDGHNTFPHSSGIASSASSMAALALSLLDLKEQVTGTKEEDFFKKASFLARIGSGSAARSTFAQAASWGEFAGQGSDEFASPVPIHESLTSTQNKILILEKGEKKVSSTAGHALMNGHPYAQARFEQATTNWQKALDYLKEGDWDALGPLVELEAMSLHAMMMTSTPSYMLMLGESLQVIECIVSFRKDTGIPVYYTLDAGPNIHMLYPSSHQKEVEAFFQAELLSFCQNGAYLDDSIGEGPSKNAI